MHNDNDRSHGLHAESMLLGFAAGVIGTLLFATYRQKEFDRVVEKARDLNEKGGERLRDMGQRAHEFADNITHASTRGVKNAERATRDMLETLDDGVKDASGNLQKRIESSSKNLG